MPVLGPSRSCNRSNPQSRCSVPEELVPAAAAAGPLSADERAEVQSYIDQLTASGRTDLAERVAASLVISSASLTASRSAKD